MRLYQTLIAILLSGLGPSACINETDQSQSRTAPQPFGLFGSRLTNDELMPGDPDYPAGNPAPTQVVQFTAIIPASLSNQFHLRYEVEVGKNAYLPFLPSQSPAGCRWTQEKQFYVDMMLPLARAGDRYSGSFSPDLFLPGTCRWHLEGLTSSITYAPILTFQHSRAADSRPPAGVDLETDVRHLWCTRHQGGPAPNQRPNCVPFEDITQWTKLPDGFRDTIAASQKEAGRHVANQYLKTLIIELHDLDALVDGYLGRTQGTPVAPPQIVDCKKASTATEQAICDKKPPRELGPWIALKNPEDSGQLLIDVTHIDVVGLHDPSGEIRIAYEVKLVPTTYAMDDTTKKRVLYEEMQDEFNCLAGTAFRTHLNMYYDDGTWQGYMPWGKPTSMPPWRTVRLGTALDSERQFMCALHLAANSPADTRVGVERIFGPWHVDRTLGGMLDPLLISEARIAWTLKDQGACSVSYRVVARVEGSTFPAESLATDNPGSGYSTFVLDLGPKSCAPWWGPVTISLASTNADSARFFASSNSQSGTLHRVSPRENP